MAADMEVITLIFEENKARLAKTVSVLKNEYTTIRAGRANPHVLDKVQVDYYGQMTPINQVGHMAVQDGRCLVITPWDKSMLKGIEKAILSANVGLTPTNDGTVVRLVFPELTEERRKELCKQVKKMGEESKVAARNIRRDTLDQLKKMNKNKEITDDEYAGFAKDVDKEVTKEIESIDKLSAEKEKDVMTV